MCSVFGLLSILGFGGGKGIFPQMQIDTVDVNHWLTAAQFAQYYTIGKLVPGPGTIMVVLIGFGLAGFVGAAVAALALFVPSSVMMYFVGRQWDRWRENPLRVMVARGLEPAIVGLVWASVFTIGRGSVKDIAGYVIAGVVTLLSLRTPLPTPALILGAGVAGAIFLR
jgi:chromate transporter